MLEKSPASLETTPLVSQVDSQQAVSRLSGWRSTTRVFSLPLVVDFLKVNVSPLISVVWSASASDTRQPVNKQMPNKARSREVRNPKVNSRRNSSAVKIFPCPLPLTFIDKRCRSFKCIWSLVIFFLVARWKLIHRCKAPAIAVLVAAPQLNLPGISNEGFLNTKGRSRWEMVLNFHR